MQYFEMPTGPLASASVELSYQPQLRGFMFESLRVPIFRDMMHDMMGLKTAWKGPSFSTPKVGRVLLCFVIPQRFVAAAAAWLCECRRCRSSLRV